MKVIFSGLINDATNKMGDVVASRNRYGSFFRTRKDTPKNYSPYWYVIRDQTALLRSAWQLLSESDRNLWNVSVSNFHRTDILANPYHLSGANYFIGVNVNRFLCGFPQLATPPQRTFVPRLDFVSISTNVAGSLINVGLSAPIPVNHSAKLWLSPAISPGINRPYHAMRLLKVCNNTFVTGSNIFADYMTRFVNLPAIGNKLFLKFILINNITGLEGQPTSAFNFVT
jgi:hypothetical protein